MHRDVDVDADKDDATATTAVAHSLVEDERHHGNDDGQPPAVEVGAPADARAVAVVALDVVGRAGDDRAIEVGRDHRRPEHRRDVEVPGPGARDARSGVVDMSSCHHVVMSPCRHDGGGGDGYGGMVMRPTGFDSSGGRAVAKGGHRPDAKVLPHLHTSSLTR